MQWRWKRGTRKLFLVLAVSVLAIVIIYWVIDSSVKPVLLTLSENRAKSLAINAIHESVLQVMGEDTRYVDLIHVEMDDQKKVTMLSANTQLLNEIASKTVLTAQQRIEQVGLQGFDVPLGALLNVQLMAGSGPKIPIKILPVGTVLTSFESVFENAGINQTRHTISMTIKAQIQIVAPNAGKNVEVSTTVPIAETILIGDVPYSYIQVNDNRDKVYDLIPRVIP